MKAGSRCNESVSDHGGVLGNGTCHEQDPELMQNRPCGPALCSLVVHRHTKLGIPLIPDTLSPVCTWGPV